jgi:ribose transport system permease protein
MTPPTPEGPRHGTALGANLRTLAFDYLAMAVVLAGLLAYFGATSEGFLTADNLLTILKQNSSAILIAVGMTYVLIIGGIDLSVGSVLGLSGATLGVLLSQFQWGVLPAVLAALAVGTACGLLNGAVTIAWRLPSFIVTLGMLEMARGATHLLTRSVTQSASEAGAIYKASLLGLPVPILLALGAVVLGQLVLSRSVLGRHMIAIGTNEEAVRLSGIDPRPVKLAVFALTGLLAGLAAVIDVAHFKNAVPTAGAGYELAAIAAVVIGGTSLMGGRGSVVSSFFGVLIIAVLTSGLAAKQVGDENKRLVTGLVIVAASILDHYRQRLWKGR